MSRGLLCEHPCCAGMEIYLLLQEEAGHKGRAAHRKPSLFPAASCHLLPHYRAILLLHGKGREQEPGWQGGRSAKCSFSKALSQENPKTCWDLTTGDALGFVSPLVCSFADFGVKV